MGKTIVIPNSDFSINGIGLKKLVDIRLYILKKTYDETGFYFTILPKVPVGGVEITYMFDLDHSWDYLLGSEANVLIGLGKTSSSNNNLAAYYNILYNPNSGITSEYIPSTTGVKHTVYLGLKGIVLDTVPQLTADLSARTINPLYIMAHRTTYGLTLWNYCSAKIYYVKVFDADGNIIHHLRPAVDNGVICMYDSVTENFVKAPKEPENEESGFIISDN